MPLTQQDPAHEQPHETAIGEYEFKPKLNPRWALSWPQVGVVALFGLLFLLFSYLPLRVTDIWGHVAYGQWMLAHQALPTEDIWMPLAKGVPVVNSAWLAQVIFGAVDRVAGPEGLSALFAVVSLLIYIIWMRIFYLQTERIWLSIVCLLLILAIGWSRVGTIRPENFAVLFFALTFLLIAQAHTRSQREADPNTTLAPLRFGWSMWLGIPIIYALWANIHGSYLCGFAVLGSFFLGRVIDVAWKQRSIVAPLYDRTARNWLWICELAFFATLVNPYGFDLLVYNLTFAKNPNLSTILEWQPLVINSVGGREFAFSWVLLLIAFRLSRRPVAAAEVILLAIFTVATIGGIRMIGWYAAAYMFVIAPHLSASITQYFPGRNRETALAGSLETEDDLAAPIGAELPPGHSFRYSLVALLIVWITFALAPISQPLLGRQPRSAKQLYDNRTPLELTEYLRKSPPKGQVFNPQWWGDWLMRAGPAGLQAMVTSNIHLVPPQVWNDYVRVRSASVGWDTVLDRYHIDTVIVDKENLDSLYRTLLRSENWQIAYDDNKGVVFTRTTPAPKSTGRETAAPKTEIKPPMEKPR